MAKPSLLTASAVEHLDPLMRKVMEGCTKETAMKLKEVIPMVDAHSLHKLHTFILVPLLGEIGNPKVSKEVKKLLLDSVHDVLTHVQLTDIFKVKNILTMLMMEIFDKDSPNMIKNVPEEMKLSTMNCVLAIIKNMPSDTQDKFYVKDNIPNICQIAYTCLELAESEKLRSLRIRAMEVVLALQQAPVDGLDTRSPWERQEIANIFQFILPGASSKLMSIISGDVTQGSKVLATAIITLSSTIALVMEDYNIADAEDVPKLIDALIELSKNPTQEEKHETILECTTHDADGMKKLIASSKGRTPEYRKKIAANLKPYLNKIGAQFEHSNIEVCKAVVQSCFLILLRCPVSLKESLPPLLDSLIALTVHEDDKVREESNSCVGQLTEFFYERNGYDFIQLAEENFYLVLTRLPRIVQEEGGARGASSIALLSGYVQLLRPSMRNILSSAAHLQRLILSLLHVITLDCSNINVSNEHSMRQLVRERCDDLNVPWTRLRFSSDRAVISNLQQLSDIFAEQSIGVFEFLGSQLMDTLYTVPHFRKESMFLLNIILLSGGKKGNENAYQLASSLLEAYLAPDLWPRRESGRSITTIARVQQDIALVCLLTEGIGCCTYVLGKEKTQKHLLKLLYPLLEHAGSANSCIALAGRRALTWVSLSCGHDSDLMALISNNMDYLSHCMSIRLRHTDEQMGVFDALSLILQHSSPEIALGLYNIVLNVLQQSSDKTQSKNNEAHLRVFLTFAHGVRHWLCLDSISHSTLPLERGIPKADELCRSLDENFHMAPLHSHSNQGKWSAVQRLKAYRQNVKVGSSYNEIIEEQNHDPSEELPQDMRPHVMAEKMNDDVELEGSPEEKKEEIPELAKLLVLVLERCLHFLPCQSVEHQFLAIRTLGVGLKALEPFTDTVLPLVHKIWSPLVGRFKATQPPLILRTAFELLQTMTLIAKDFLSSRIIREVLPQLCKFLRDAFGESHLKDSGSAYRFSQKYKAQLSLLSGLGSLAIHLQLRGQDFYNLLTVSLLYLSSYQPRPLQAASVSLIQSLYTLDADAVWWALVSWWTPPYLTKCLQLPCTSSHQDCEENVRHLLGLSASDGTEENPTNKIQE